MAKLALYGELKAKPGKEGEVEAFLKQGAEMAKAEGEPFIGTPSRKTGRACTASSIRLKTRPGAMRTCTGRLHRH